MRILHTSDWHLGRSFHREDLLGHQAEFVDHLLEVVVRERVDVVLVPGDVYDRALPPVDAVHLADEAFARLAASPARVVVTSGNHDSAQRLGFGSRLIDAAGVFIRTSAATVGTPVVLDDEHGPVAVHALPYLDPRSLVEPWQLPVRSHQAALDAAMVRVRADLAARGGRTRSVVMAHAFVAGAEPSDSERDISVGGVSRIATSSFDGIDYVALGHLHGRHTLTDAIRYSGSPLAYSFSEADQRKGSWLVDLGRRRPRQRRVRRGAGPAPPGPADRRPRGPAGRPAAGGARGRLGPGHPDRPGPSGARDGPPARPLPARPGPRLRPAGGARARPPRPAPPDAATTRSPSTSCAELRGAPASAAESALLREAVDACCEDTDVDVLVGER